jgi:protease IV
MKRIYIGLSLIFITSISLVFYTPTKKSNSSIFVIEINGPIVSSHLLISMLYAGVNDKGSKAILLRINSSGGSLSAAQEVYNEIKAIDLAYNKSKGKIGKPIFASLDTVATSHGYFISTAARRIYAVPGTLIGSIGVKLKFKDYSKLYNLLGVNKIAIKTGSYKDMGFDYRVMTKNEKSLIKDLAINMKDQIINDIMSRRKWLIKDNINKVSNGEIFSGRQALDLGLIDRPFGIWDAGRDIHEYLNINKKVSFKYLRQKKSWKQELGLDQEITVQY